MAVLNAQGIRYTLRTTTGGEACENIFDYHGVLAGSFATPVEHGLWFTGTVLPLLRDALSNSTIFQWVRLDFSPQGGTPPYAPYTISLGSVPGLRTGDCLPPQDAYRIWKIVDPATEEPDTPPRPWRQGMVRLSGVAESDQSNGLVNPPQITRLNAIAAVIGDHVVTGVDFAMHYSRHYPTPQPIFNDFWVTVVELVEDGLITTQNTRKIGR